MVLKNKEDLNNTNNNNNTDLDNTNTIKHYYN